MREGLLAGLFALGAMILAGRPAAAPQTTPNVDLTGLRYSELVERIKALRGKVAVVDFWADYCAPCKREFPKLVQLHRKHARAGLACVSVDLDDTDDGAALTRVRRFLADQKADFANYQLAEKPEVWQTKLKIDGPPCVFVFNRQGELIKKLHGDVDYNEIEKIVVDALKN
jgi:thiol-disulfide isomerase/thioredoxin